MKDNSVRLGPREEQIVDLLLQGCDNSEIARQLKMAPRTVKAHFNRLFLRFGIRGGIKRVKLATLLYRRQLCSEASGTERGFPASGNSESSNSSLKVSRIAKSPMPLEPPSMSSKTIFASSMTNSASGTASNLRSGTRPTEMKPQPRPEKGEHWEGNVLSLDASAIRGRNLLEQ